MRLRKLIPAAILGAAHFVIHFTLPIADLILHGAFFLSIYYGARNA